MMKSKTITTGSDVDRDGSRSANTIEKYLCSHCDTWKEEVEEDGNNYYCDDCISDELIKCSVCGHYVPVEDYIGFHKTNEDRIIEWDRLVLDENFKCDDCQKKEKQA